MQLTFPAAAPLTPPHPGPRLGRPLIPSRSLGSGNRGPPHEYSQAHLGLQAHGHPDTLHRQAHLCVHVFGQLPLSL